MVVFLVAILFTCEYEKLVEHKHKIHGYFGIADGVRF